MFQHSIGVQAVGGSGSSTPTAIDANIVTDQTKANHCVYKASFAAFAVTGGGTWDQLIAAGTIPENAVEMEVFYAGADDIDIGFGAAAAEDDEFRIIPGGNGRIPVAVAANTRVAIRGNGAGSSVDLVINFYGP